MDLQILETISKELSSKGSFRESIKKAQKIIDDIPGSLQGQDIEQLCPTKHSFAPGLYVREMFIPKGTIILGRIHKQEHPNFVMRGKIKVISEETGERIVKAPCHFISKQGTQRIGLALRDTVWVTIHLNPNNVTDLEKIVDEVSFDNFEDYDKYEAEQNKAIEFKTEVLA